LRNARSRQKLELAKLKSIAQGQKAFPFRLHMRAFPCDPMANFLLERWLEMPLTRVVLLDRGKKAAILDEALAAFDRVVDIAQTHDLAAWHSPDLGIPEAAERTNTAEKWERHTGWKSLDLGHLAGAERAELHDRLALDRYLWRRWALGESVALEPSTCTLELYSELARPGYEIRRRIARGLG
jgi:hypothetical protein